MKCFKHEEHAEQIARVPHKESLKTIQQRAISMGKSTFGTSIQELISRNIEQQICLDHEIICRGHVGWCHLKGRLYQEKKLHNEVSSDIHFRENNKRKALG